MGPMRPDPGGPGLRTTTALTVPAAEATVPYAYHVRAVDADPGDTLTFRLVDGPAGAAIDGLSGWLTWDAGPRAEPYSFTVAVDDGRGGSDAEPFPLTVTSGSAGAIEGRVGVGAPDLTVAADAPIFLAGRTAVTPPPAGVSDPAFPLIRTNDPGASAESPPPSIPTRRGRRSRSGSSAVWVALVVLDQCLLQL